MIDSKKTCPKVENEKSVATSTSSVITRKGDSTSQSTTSMTTLDHPNEETGDDDSNVFRFHYERNIDEGKRKDYMITVVRSSSEWYVRKKRHNAKTESIDCDRLDIDKMYKYDWDFDNYKLA